MPKAPESESGASAISPRAQLMVLPAGLEPALPPYQSGVLPVERWKPMVPARVVDSLASALRGRRSTLSYTDSNDGEGGIRTRSASPQKFQNTDGKGAIGNRNSCAAGNQ